jgi:hypothetical protein
LILGFQSAFLQDLLELGEQGFFQARLGQSLSERPDRLFIGNDIFQVKPQESLERKPVPDRNSTW